MQSSTFEVFKFYVVDPAQIPDVLREFFQANAGVILGIESITTFTLAVQKPASVSLSIAGRDQQAIEYQFHYLIVYRIQDPENQQP